MGPFALPVPSWRLQTQRKRKRELENEKDDFASSEIEVVSSSSRLPSDTINPRSHSPNTLRQFVVAGLSPAEEVPSKAHPNFPHKALSPKRHSRTSRSRRDRSQSRTSTLGSGSEADIDTDGESNRQNEIEAAVSSSEKFKHMSTMMAILHRCIHDGDMPRAKRAFGLLIRTKDTDIRLNEMWTLGTEILMRDGERNNDKHKITASALRDDSSEPPPRWGSANNVEKVRNYLETLAQYHPYDHHYPRSISAIDFWPALYSIEIYNIDAEYRRALQRIDETVTSVDDSEIMSDPPVSQQGSEMGYEIHTRRHDEEGTNSRWETLDEIRHDTQVAARQIAERMDNLMQTVPYTTHVELLRLRGMLSLFIGDLYVPTRLLRSGTTDDDGVGDGLRKLSLTPYVAHNADDSESIRHREQEIEGARSFFARIVDRGGQLEPWLHDYLYPDDDQASSLP